MAKNLTIENYNRIMHDLHGSMFKPMYVLMGEETYFIDQISNYIAQNAVPPEQQDFNLITIYGENTTAKEIDMAARGYPMMGERQLIIVKEAQQIRGIEELDGYAKNPVPSTILVICIKGKTLDKRTAFYKTLLKTCEVFESELFKTYDAGIVDWIADYLQQSGIGIDYAASALLVEALGVELTKITTEIDRLLMMLPLNTTKITAEHVELLGVSKDFNNFELCSALLKKDAVKVHRIINYFTKTPKSFELQSTLGAIFTQFSKLFAYQMLRKKHGSHSKIPAADLQEVMGIHPYVIAQEYAPAIDRYSPQKTVEIISYIRDCDMRSKGWGGTTSDSGDLLKELAYLILY
jgi:DNA polymerase-3 subunit delta